MDLDRVAYFDKTPMALIEDRGEGGRLYDKDQANLKAISRLANRFGLPAFFHQYANDFEWHIIRPLNNFARMFPPPHSDFLQKISDPAYCAWEHWIRGVTITVDAAERIIAAGKRDAADEPESRFELIPLDNDLMQQFKLIAMRPDDRLRLRVNLAEVMRQFPS